MEKFANLASSTLNGTINNSVTTLVVTSASSFPASGNFRIIIDSEIMLVTAVSGTTFTVTRAQESTAAASHTNGVPVSHVLTAGGLAGFRGDFSIDPALTLPAASIPGRVSVDPLAREDGSSFKTFSPGLFTRLYKPPTVAGFTWVNQGGAAAADTDHGIVLAAPAFFPFAEQARPLVKTAPATPYTVTACFTLDIGTNDHGGCGLVFRESGSGAMILLMILISGKRPFWDCRRMNSATSFNADTGTLSAYFTKRAWFRATDNGTNRIYEVSYDGLSWITILTEGRTVFLTADQFGFCNWQHQGQRSAAILTSYNQT